MITGEAPLGGLRHRAQPEPEWLSRGKPAASVKPGRHAQGQGALRLDFPGENRLPTPGRARALTSTGSWNGVRDLDVVVGEGAHVEMRVGE